MTSGAMKILRLAAIALSATMLTAVASHAADVAGEETDADAICKKKYGPNYIAFATTSGLSSCIQYSLSAFGYTGKDFAQNDLKLHGDRIWLPSGRQLPLLTYSKDDVSDDTSGAELGGGVTADVTVIHDTTNGPLVGYLQVGASTDGNFGGNGSSLADEQNIYNNGTVNIYPGVIQQAWVRYQNVQAGVQQSKFDFLYSGFSAFPGYAVKRRTLAAAATKNWGDVSLSVAAEDSSQRQMEDGVIANYDEEFYVDPVVQLRARYYNGIYQASGALHRVTFDGADYGMDDKQTWGVAGRVGAVYEFHQNVDKDSGEFDHVSRFMVTGAAAKGALGYLGIPNLAIDYTVNGQDDMELSTGASGVVAFDHMFTAETRGSITASGFVVDMRTDSNDILDMPSGQSVYFDQNVKVYGALLQLDVEHQLRPNLMIGAEASYTWTKAKGDYNDYEANDVVVDYPEIKAYMSWKLQ